MTSLDVINTGLTGGDSSTQPQQTFFRQRSHTVSHIKPRVYVYVDERENRRRQTALQLIHVSAQQEQQEED